MILLGVLGLVVLSALVLSQSGIIMRALFTRTPLEGSGAPAFSSPQEQNIQNLESKDNPQSPVPYQVERFVTGLEVPWSIVFTSPDRMLVTERSGSIRIVENGQLQPEPLVRFPEVSSQSEEGLMGMALHPQYETNKQVYAAYAYPSNGALAVRIVRFIDSGSSASGMETIVEDIPAAQNHAGTRLRFGPDEKLYITTGDASDREIAQDLESLGGKILRVNDDGSIPQDNPFPDSPVYSYGHRNAQGIDWHPPTSMLFSTEHGPSGFDGPGGGDEINIITSGQNYGWPLVSHTDSQEDMVSPLLVYTPAIAPASGLFYTGDVFPQFTNNYFVGLLRGEGILRVEVNDNDPSQVISHAPLEGIDVGRIREVAQGQDGFIYFTTSNQDGRGTPREGDDSIYRLVPRE